MLQTTIFQRLELCLTCKFFQMIWPIRWEFYKWDWHAFWPPKNPPLYSRKYECNYHFVEGSFLWVWRFKGKKHKVAVVNFQHFSTKIWHGKKEYGKIAIGWKRFLYIAKKNLAHDSSRYHKTCKKAIKIISFHGNLQFCPEFGQQFLFRIRIIVKCLAGFAFSKCLLVFDFFTQKGCEKLIKL